VSHPGAPGEVHREPLVVVDEVVAERRSLLIQRPELPPMPWHHLERAHVSNA
jgi:hypothetical protein